MNSPRRSLRIATARDGPQLLRLWALLFDEAATAANELWRNHAQQWFARHVDDSSTARFPVADIGGEIVATAIGTLELGVPNPMCVRGPTVRLANVITVPEHRGCGYGTSLVRDVIEWARSIDADRVDLSSTELGQGLYDKEGFVLTSAPRMKLIL